MATDNRGQAQSFKKIYIQVQKVLGQINLTKGAKKLGGKISIHI